MNFLYLAIFQGVFLDIKVHILKVKLIFKKHSNSALVDCYNAQGLRPATALKNIFRQVKMHFTKNPYLHKDLGYINGV